MKANYHTHTFRCNHAAPNERAYVEAAIDGGFDILGFTDHAPYFFENGYYSSFRMRPELAEDYFTTLYTIKNEYKGKIEIHVGLEAEYYPQAFDRLLRLAKDNKCEYLILGQHFLDWEPNGHYSGELTNDEAFLKKYVDQTSEGLKTGCYTYFAHPDFIAYRGDSSIYRKHVLRLCENAAENNVPLEFNLLGFREHRNYPFRPFWEIAAEVGNDVVIGCDAHEPGVFLKSELWNDAVALLDEIGVKRIETVKLKSL